MRDRLHQLGEALKGCMAVDRFRIARRLRALRDAPNPPAPVVLDEVANEIQRARRRVDDRKRFIPRTSYDTALPVVQKREEIAKAIAEHQVVVICGETGSGKTTQLPKICLDVGRGVTGVIGHTQPRRIAARSVAARIADELGTPLGQSVGYKIRFGDKTTERTCIKVMTDGILLAETQHDRPLAHYDTIIIDEAHERSLNIDFLMGYLRQLLPRRPDLKVIITSATIDPQRFSRHFGNAPIVEVSGRTYPVEVRYLPLAGQEEDQEDLALEDGILHAVDEITSEMDGDILVFLPGEREIRMAADDLRKQIHRLPRGTEILPLFARLSTSDQQKIFERHATRRIILATNVAETSLTVPGIRAVIDSGLARISRYSPTTKVQRLPIEAVSRASADQRKGRCGRVADGLCIRLYSEQDYAGRDQFTDPEIQRTNLASVILQMKSLNLGRIDDFPFIDPPDSRQVKDGYETLRELGAIDDKDELTEIGRRLAKLPLDPRVGRMILAGAAEGCTREAVVIAAALSVQDVRDRPMEKADRADEAHAQFHHPDSDFITLLNIWKFYQEEGEKLSSNALRRACHENFLSFLRLREWESTHKQLRDLAEQLGLKPNDKPADYDAIHRAILTGLLGNVGRKGEQGIYNGCRGLKFNIHPGSAVFKKAPQWVMAAEIVQTTKTYARMVARIDQSWIERLGSSLVKRTYHEPHWDRKEQQVFAYEKVLLFGLEIVSKRRVNYGPIDPGVAREVFIQLALSEEEFDSQAPYWMHNLKLLHELKRLEAKTRSHEFAVDPRLVFQFYDTRLGPGVHSTSTLDIWRKTAERADSRMLFMSRETLFPAKGAIKHEAFPDQVSVFGTKLNLVYKFEPGKADDGVTMTVPLEALHQLTPEQCEWLVPGQLPKKVEALLDMLPKTVRKDLGDLHELAGAAATGVDFGKGDLINALSDAVETLTSVKVPRDAWRTNQLPDHLKLNIRVVDDKKHLLAEGRDVVALKAKFADQAKRSFVAAAGEAFSRDGLTDWDFGELPEKLDVQRGGSVIVGYPSVIDNGKNVSLRLLDTPQEAKAATRAGVRRLFVLCSKDELKYQLGLLPELGRMAMHYGPMGSGEEFRDELVCAIADRVFMAGQGEVRNKEQFDERLVAGWGRLHQATMEVGQVVLDTLLTAARMDQKLDRKRLPQAWNNAAGDMKLQIALLIQKGVFAWLPFERLRHYPRYLRGVLARYEKLKEGGLARDGQLMAEMSGVWRGYLKKLDPIIRGQQNAAGELTGPLKVPPALEEFRWALEELRVSLWAQDLGTAQTVSVKRLEKMWTDLKLG